MKVKVECTDCKATGIYSGFAEKEGCGVVCSSCRGTGCTEISYTEFTHRRKRSGINHVFHCNPGVWPTPEKFGGMPYEDWLVQGKFPKGSEIRAFTCPAWWYQCADYSRKPHWKECDSNLGGSFSGCHSFQSKDKCWERFDKHAR